MCPFIVTSQLMLVCLRKLIHDEVFHFDLARKHLPSRVYLIAYHLLISSSQFIVGSSSAG